MPRDLVKSSRDSKTIDVVREEANQADQELFAKRVTVISGMIPNSYDYLEVSYPTSTSESYLFKSGGRGGAEISVLTVVYTDSTKANLSSVERS